MDRADCELEFAGSLIEGRGEVSDLESDESLAFLRQASSCPTFGGNKRPRPGSMLLNGIWNTPFRGLSVSDAGVLGFFSVESKGIWFKVLMRIFSFQPSSPIDGNFRFVWVGRPWVESPW